MDQQAFNLMNVRDAAAFLAVHPNTIRRWAQANKLPGRRLGARGDWRFTREDLADMPLAPAVALRDRHANGAQSVARQVLRVADNADTPSYDARYRALFEMAPVAIYTCDASGVIQEVNQRAIALWGREPECGDPRERFCGSFKSFYPDGRSMPHDASPMARVLRGDCIGADGEAILIERPDGTRREVMTHPQVLRDEREKIIGAINCLYDVTGRTQAEEKARRGETDLRDSLENASLGLHWVGPDGTILWANQSELDLLGYTREEYIGHHIAQFHADAPVIEDMLTRLAANETLHEYGARLRHKDGSIRHVVINSNAFFENDTFVHIRCFTRDITEHKRTEEVLHESERHFQEMIDALPAAIYTTDAQGRLTHFNPAAVTFSGRVPELGTDRWCVTWKLYHPDGTSMPHDECPMAIALKEGRIIRDAEAIAERPDGKRIWFTPYPTPLRDAEGRIVGGINMLLDITERKQAEETRARLAAIVESSDDAIVSKDLNSIITSWNEGAQRLFGYTAEEAIGRSITMLIPPDRHDEEPEILARIRRGDRVEHYETIRRRKDGTLRDISLTISPLVDSQGVIVGASKIARDITERRALERQKDAFIGVASHELKTPVTSIKGYAQLLGRRFRTMGDAPATAMLTKLDGQIDRLTGLIEDLLDITRIESGKLVLRQTPFDLNELIDEIVDEAQHTTDKHTIVREHATPVTLIADRDRIGQVLTNLLTNAIKYSSQADRILVQSVRDGENVVVSVKDFGIGIPTAEQPRIFERFFRVDGENRAGYPGLGLGLYIAAEFVKRHGGAIWVESEEGAGTTMAFSLPLDSPCDDQADRMERAV